MIDVQRKPVFFLTLLVAACLTAVPVAAQSRLICFGEDQCRFTLNEQVLKQNVARRITRSMKASKVLDKPLPPENVLVLRKLPFQVDDLQMFAVKVKIMPMQAGQKAGINYLVVDPGGSKDIRGILDLATGVSVIDEAMIKIRQEQVPADFGEVIAEGQGQAEVVLVSEPLCSYCRAAYKSFMKKLELIKSLRLAHFPIASHLGADTACGILIYARRHNLEPEKVIDFAYTKLKEVKPKGTNLELVRHMKVGVLEQFLKEFPDLKKQLGDNADKALEKLESETKDELEASKKTASALDITGTPVIYINSVRLDGLNKQAMETLLRRPPGKDLK